MIDPAWLENSTAEELDVYMGFVKDLNSKERLVRAYNRIMNKSDYEIGEMIGKGEIIQTLKRKGKTIEILGSNYVNDIIERTRANLVLRLQERFPGGGEANGAGRMQIREDMKEEDKILHKVWYANSVEYGFHRMMLEHLFPNEPQYYPGVSGDFIRRRFNEQNFEMVSLFLDVPRLSETFSKWAESNRKKERTLRMA